MAARILNKKKRLFSKKVKKAQKENYKKFVSAPSNIKETAKLNKILQNGKTKRIGLLSNADKTATNMEEKVRR